MLISFTKYVEIIQIPSPMPFVCHPRPGSRIISTPWEVCWFRNSPANEGLRGHVLHHRTSKQDAPPEWTPQVRPGQPHLWTISFRIYMWKLLPSFSSRPPGSLWNRILGLFTSLLGLLTHKHTPDNSRRFSCRSDRTHLSHWPPAPHSYLALMLSDAKRDGLNHQISAMTFVCFWLTA